MSSLLKFTRQGQGQSLVFIHGWGLNSGVWQPTVEKLARTYQVITIDLPGFGLNVENTISPYTLTNISEQICNSIDEPAIFVGWSLGGLVTTQIAINHPNKVQGLVTIASSPCFIEKQTNSTEKWFGIKPQVLQMFYQQLDDDIEKTLASFLKIQAMGSPHIRQDIKQLRDLIMDYPIPSKHTLAQSLQLLSSEDLRSQLSHINVPFLRMYGRLDSLVPKAAIEAIDKLAPNSEAIIFNKASHVFFISHFDEFIEQLTTWLNRNY